MEEILITYCDCGSMKKTAIIHGINAQKVRKILITLNAFESDQRRVIKKLADEGKSDQCIADILSVSVNYVNSYLPYKKGVYNDKNPTINALRIRKSRESKENSD